MGLTMVSVLYKYNIHNQKVLILTDKEDILMYGNKLKYNSLKDI